MELQSFTTERFFAGAADLCIQIFKVWFALERAQVATAEAIPLWPPIYGNRLVPISCTSNLNSHTEEAKAGET